MFTKPVDTPRRCFSRLFVERNLGPRACGGRKKELGSIDEPYAALPRPQRNKTRILLAGPRALQFGITASRPSRGKEARQRAAYAVVVAIFSATPQKKSATQKPWLRHRTLGQTDRPLDCRSLWAQPKIFVSELSWHLWVGEIGFARNY
jgi:hypothetical protein